MQIQKTLQSMCWNVKKLTSSQLVKKTPRENEKNKKSREVVLIHVQDQNRVIKESKKMTKQEKQNRKKKKRKKLKGRKYRKEGLGNNNIIIIKQAHRKRKRKE